MGARIVNRQRVYWRNPAGEVGSTLSKEEKQKVLQSMRDVYKDRRLDKVEKGFDARGEIIWGYPYAPEYFLISSITGKPIRYYVTLPGGKIAHPTEIYPNVKQSDIDKELMARQEREKQEQDWIAGKLSRIVKLTDEDPMQKANIIYHGRNRPREGSYFAYDGRGNIVRVDGNDPRDVKFFEERGFYPKAK